MMTRSCQGFHTTMLLGTSSSAVNGSKDLNVSHGPDASSESSAIHTPYIPHTDSMIQILANRIFVPEMSMS